MKHRLIKTVSLTLLMQMAGYPMSATAKPVEVKPDQTDQKNKESGYFSIIEKPELVITAIKKDPAPVIAVAVAPTADTKVSLMEQKNLSNQVDLRLDDSPSKKELIVTPPEALKPTPTWSLRAGKMIGNELQEWAPKGLCAAKELKEGWTVVWQVPKDWNVASNATFTGDFKSAATQVIKSLAENGAIIRAHFHDANCTLVVSGPGVIAK